MDVSKPYSVNRTGSEMVDDKSLKDIHDDPDEEAGKQELIERKRTACFTKSE